MTKKRRAVLSVLEESGMPLSASDIAGRIGEGCDLATVYRALHGLEGLGLAEAFAFECSERGIERYYLPRREGHRHFFHCEKCHSFVDLGECRMEPLVREAERELGLSVTAHTLYLRGYCAACAQPSGTGSPREIPVGGV